MLGMSQRSQTMHNLVRERECVLNLPSVAQVKAVNQLALTTGRNPVPEYKSVQGYRYEPDKFAIAGLTSLPSQLVQPQRVQECPVQMEAILKQSHRVEEHMLAAEVEIVCTHIEDALLVPGTDNHINPDAWKPLIMSFTEFYGLGERVHDSRLARIFRPNQT